MSVESKTIVFQGNFLLVSALAANVLDKFQSSDTIYVEFCSAWCRDE
jgi:hypothetical protein